MGVRLPGQGTTSLVTNTLVNANETIILTVFNFNIALDTAGVMLFWYFLYTPGGSVTATTVKLRRGNALTSPLINAGLQSASPLGAQVTFSGCYFDVPGPSAGISYSLSVTQVSGASNGTINDASLLVVSL